MQNPALLRAGTRDRELRRDPARGRFRGWTPAPGATGLLHERRPAAPTAAVSVPAVRSTEPRWSPRNHLRVGPGDGPTGTLEPGHAPGFEGCRLPQPPRWPTAAARRIPVPG